jgi:hypothetical protein
MDLEFVPLLGIQRDLYRLPRDMERFHAYLKTMRGNSVDDLEVPLVAMNPMAGEHVPELIDRLLELRADEVGAAAVAAASEHLKAEPGRFKVGIVVADDLRGRWTNRYVYELGHRLGAKPLYKRGWIVPMLWSSEVPDAAAIREEVLTSVHRAAYIGRHGMATSLSGILAQEGAAMARAGCVEPHLAPDDLEYTRAVIEPLLGATEHSIIIPCLFGDEAATSLGYRPQGLSPRAGFALALHQAREGRVVQAFRPA